MNMTEYPRLPLVFTDGILSLSMSNLHLVTTQQTRSLFANAQPVVASSELQLQANHTPHNPAQREDCETKGAPVDESRAVRCLADDDRKKSTKKWRDILGGRLQQPSRRRQNRPSREERMRRIRRPSSKRPLAQ